MTITFNSARSVQEYNDIRYKLILQLEESGVEEPVPYLDSKGIATIGAGFNLRVRDNIEVILEKGFGISSSDLTDAILDTANALKSDFDNYVTQYKQANPAASDVAANQFAHNAVSNQTPSPQQRLNTAFQSASEVAAGTAFEIVDSPDGTTAADKIRAVFDALAPEYETTLRNRFYSGTTLWDENDYPDERLALISLEYNNGNTLVGDGLKTAMQNGDRFEAWYQIRYASNGGSSASRGIAKRRYLESEIFGLFETNTPSDSEAEEVINDFLDSTLFSKIQLYEDKYWQQLGAANADCASILAELSGVEKVLSRGEIFKPISSYLVTVEDKDGQLELKGRARVWKINLSPLLFPFACPLCFVDLTG